MELIISLIISILFTALFYLAFPLVLIIRKTRMTEKKIRKTAIWNSVIVFIIFTIIHIATDGEPSNPTAAFVWYFIVQAILKHFCLEDEEVLTTPDEPIIIEPIDTEDAITPTKVETRPVQTSSVVQPLSKQEHKPVKKNNTSFVVAIIALSILVVGLGAFNIVQYLTIAAQEEEIAELQEELDKKPDYIVDNTANEEASFLGDFYLKNSNKVKFYDEHIVFVIDGYGNYYYTYDQMQIVTQGIDEYSYWAYNKEQAISLGYQAWK